MDNCPAILTDILIEYKPVMENKDKQSENSANIKIPISCFFIIVIKSHSDSKLYLIILSSNKVGIEILILYFKINFYVNNIGK